MFLFESLESAKSLNTSEEYITHMNQGFSIKSFKQYLKEGAEDSYELKYEDWKGEGYSLGYPSWNLYRNGVLVCGISNDSKDQNRVIIRHVESKEKGMASKLIFMLLDRGVVIETGKPGYNSISTSAYYLFKKLSNLIGANNKYRCTKLGKADNTGKEDDLGYRDVADKEDNFHYRFGKR